MKSNIEAFMKKETVPRTANVIAAVKTDGSNTFARIFIKKGKTYSLDPNSGKVTEIQSNEGSIKGYNAAHPGRQINKLNLSETQQQSKDIFKVVYKLHPYSEFKKKKEVNDFKYQLSQKARSFKDKRSAVRSSLQSAQGLGEVAPKNKYTQFDFYKEETIKYCQLHKFDYSLLFDDKWLSTLLSNEYNNFNQRMSRFEHKAYLNRFNYFVTITWDPKIINDEDQFRQTLKSLFNHLADRWGIHFIGVFERGTNGTERLHFHGFCMIDNSYHLPPGWNLASEKHFNFKHKNIHRYLSNDYFTSRFGVNEFDDINTLNYNDADYRSAVEYCLKYMSKDQEHFYLGRGIPDVLYIVIDDNKNFVDTTVYSASLDYPGRWYLYDDTLDVNTLYGLKSS